MVRDAWQYPRNVFFVFFPDEPKFGGSDLCIHIMFTSIEIWNFENLNSSCLLNAWWNMSFNFTARAFVPHFRENECAFLLLPALFATPLLIITSSWQRQEVRRAEGSCVCHPCWLINLGFPRSRKVRTPREETAMRNVFMCTHSIQTAKIWLIIHA